MGKTVFQGLKERSVLMAILLAVACFLTYYFHAVLEVGTVFTHFFYIPIILASLWWQRRGLFVAIFLAALLILSHIFLRADMPAVNDYFRAAMFIAIAFVIAMLSERIAKSGQENAHLNLILRTIRNVNQLIVKEKDREKLIQGVCDNLVEARGYSDAWIALLDEYGKSVAYAECGLGKSFLPMVERLKRSQLPTCGQRALKQSEAVVTEDPVSTCTDCSLSSNYAGRRALVVRLEYGGRVYGLLSVSVPRELAHDAKELDLFRETATDVAFALHDIEREEQRKQAEDKVRWLAKFPSENPNPVLRVAKDGTVLYANRASLALLNMWNSQTGDLIPESWREFVVDVLHSGSPKASEVKCGEQILSLTFAPVVGADYINLYGLDITERKQVEMALQESEERYRSLLNLGGKIGEAIIMLQDTEKGTGIHTFVSEEWARLTGYSEEELLGMSMLDLIHPRDRDAALERHKMRMQGKSIPELIEITIIRKDGIEVPVEVTGAFTTYKGKRASVIYIRDITERKRAEDEIKQFQTMVETARYGVGVTLLDGTITYANNTLAKMHGYSPEELIGNNLSMFYKEDQMPVINKLRDRLSQTGGFTNEEVWRKKKDGTVFLSLMTGSLIRDDKGNPLYMIASTLDITERKQTEEEVKKFKVVIEEANYGVAWFNADEGIILYVNEAFAEMHGYTCDELIGCNYSVLLTKEQLEDVNRLRQRLLSTANSETLELWKKRKDGSIFPTLTTSILIKDDKGKPLFLAVTSIDISRQKQAEEDIKKFKAITDNANYGVAMVTLDDKFTYVNETYAKMHGYKTDEIVGKEFKVLYSKEQLPVILRLTERLMQTGSFVNEEVWHSRKDGTIFPAIMNARLMSDDRGKPYRVGTIIDITERKQAEEERTKYAKLESVGTLAGGIAHDFNNILTGIMGNISLARRHVEPKSKAEERLLEAEKASIRARDLTQQLLTFSRGGAPVKSIVSIAGLLKESIGFALRGSNLRCDFDLPDNLWPVEVDEGQINQVITNIVINAQEAMPEGGVINITAGNTEIKERSTLPLNKGRYVLITIADRGVGIRKEHLDRIFDPYFTTKQKGSGLGLATSYSVIKNHGGYITVDSAPVVGTAFQIYLPASKKSVAVEKETKDGVITSGEGRILVMDDEEMVRDLLYAELTEVGYNVELVSDGAEAIEQYAKAKESGQPFDAVIMDLTIPGGMGGKEAIKKLLKIDPQAKAIVSSGYATDLIMSEYKKYGFSAVVAKPYSVAQIEKTLHGLLGKKK